MISWGLVSGAFVLTRGPISFIFLRFSPGLAEAGFFPGMILHFNYWFPPLRAAPMSRGTRSSASSSVESAANLTPWIRVPNWS
jgi:MFS family permease